MFFIRGTNKFDEPRMNERIRAREIRVIGDDGEQFGVLSVREALAIAAEKELDIVEISPNATPPVCKIMDYGKFQLDPILSPLQLPKPHEQIKQKKTKKIRKSKKILL